MAISSDLLAAARRGDLDRLRGALDVLLLEHEEYPYFVWAAAIETDQVTVIDLCLEAGLDPNGTADLRPLIHAAGYRARACVDRLLAAGADPNLRDEDGHCLFHIAVGHFMKVRDLPLQADDAFIGDVSRLEAGLGEPMRIVDGGYGAVTFPLRAAIDAHKSALTSEGVNSTVADMRAGREVAQNLADVWRPLLKASWCGSWRRHPIADLQLLVVPTTDPYCVVALIQPHAGEHDIGVFEILRFLRRHEGLGWTLLGIGYDNLELRFERLPDDVDTFARELYEFCPDLIDQGFESLNRLSASLQEKRRLNLWWD